MHEIMTLVGKNNLEKELDHLIKNEREEVKMAISEARELGDLKENAEYHAAKERQALIEGRIAELQQKLNHAQIVDVKELSGNTIKFGATVQLYDLTHEKSVTYQIVGIDEASLKDNKISYKSPLGMALIGKKEKDEITVHAPKGDLEYEIEKVQYK